MSKSEILDLASSLTEGRIKRLDTKNFLNLEIAALINRRRYWWRKQVAQFSTVVGTPTYDLSAAGLNVAQHLGQIIRVLNGKNLNITQQPYSFVANDVANPSGPSLIFLGDSVSQLRAISDTTAQGPPAGWFIEPGTTKTLRLTPRPDAVYPILVHHWATYNPAKDDTDEELPAFFPDQFTRAVLAAILRTMFMYLFGAGDGRSTLAEAQYQQALEDLDSFKSPAVEQAVEIRTSDPNVWVGATS